MSSQTGNTSTTFLGVVLCLSVVFVLTLMLSKEQQHFTTTYAVDDSTTMDSLSQLFRKRELMFGQKYQAEKQLRHIQPSKTNIEGFKEIMSFASNKYSSLGATEQDAEQLSEKANTQLQHISSLERELQLKLRFANKAIEEINQQIVALVGSDRSLNMKRFAVTSRSMSFIAPNGTIMSIGRNNDGRLGVRTMTNGPFLTPVQVDTSGVLKGQTIQKLFAGGDHVLALSNEGKLFGWGDNRYCALGNGTLSSNHQYSPVLVNMGGEMYGHNVTKVVCTSNGCLTLTSDGSLFQFGNSIIKNTDRCKPTKIDTPSNKKIRDFAVQTNNYETTCVITEPEGEIYCIGGGRDGQLGTGQTTRKQNSFSKISHDHIEDGITFDKIEGGNEFFIARGSDGKLYSWGEDKHYQLGRKTNVYPNTKPYKMVNIPDWMHVRDYCTAGSYSILITDKGEAFMIGHNRYETPFLHSALFGKVIIDMECQSNSQVLFTTNGETIVWGENSNGQLGDGTTSDISKPTFVELF